MSAKKTVELLIGLSAGGGYDAYGRMLARFVGRHLPGQPQVVPRKMLVDGSLVSINHLYSVATKTGLTIGIFDPVILISPLMGGPMSSRVKSPTIFTDRP